MCVEQTDRSCEWHSEFGSRVIEHVGSALGSSLQTTDNEILLSIDPRLIPDQAAVLSWISQSKTRCDHFWAAKVGGIYANDTFPADFIYDNLAIELNLIHGAHLAARQSHGVSRLVLHLPQIRTPTHQRRQSPDGPAGTH